MSVFHDLYNWLSTVRTLLFTRQ